MELELSALSVALKMRHKANLKDYLKTHICKQKYKKRSFRVQ
jgi:hypothetical protein